MTRFVILRASGKRLARVTLHTLSRRRELPDQRLQLIGNRPIAQVVVALTDQATDAIEAGATTLPVRAGRRSRLPYRGTGRRAERRALR